VHLTEWIQHAISPLWLIVAAGLGVAAGALMGRSGKRELGTQIGQLESDVARAEAQSREQSRLVTKLRNEQRALSHFTRALPHIARELNRSDLDERQIPRLVISLVEAIFEPEQCLLYLVRMSGSDGDRQPTLHLVERNGAAELPPSVMRIKIGEGKIGWVANAKVEMLTDDWLNMTRTEGRAIEDNHPMLRLDLLRTARSITRTARTGSSGVLCVGAPAVRPRDEKLMLQMVTNLASIAYTNSRNLRQLSDLANHDGLTGLVEQALSS
jgi:hypothetical protein